MHTAEQALTFKYAHSPSGGVSFVSFPGGRPLPIVHEGEWLTIGQINSADRSRWVLREQSAALVLGWHGACSDEPEEEHMLAALDAAFALFPNHADLTIEAPLPFQTTLLECGTVSLRAGARPMARRETLWQRQDLWLRQQSRPYALHYEITGDRRHPKRSAKCSGTVYQRYIPWLGKTLTLRTVEAGRDLATFNRWMNEPAVAAFWQEEGDLAKHQAYLANIESDAHTTGFIGCFDDEPFGYFEAYWAKEDRIAPFYDADDYDRGWHVLVGDPKFRGRPFLTAWLPSISHYLFLADCRTQRIVIEPRTDNHKMIRNLSRCGYAHLKDFDFPHKRAMLGMLFRERFFGDALWVPREPSVIVD